MSYEDRNRRATRRALSSSCALLLTLALGTTQVAAQTTAAAPTQTDDAAAVEPGMPLAAEALRAELARLELELATTRDFATAEPALAELMQRVLRAGEFDGWQALLADVYVARIDLLLDMDRVEEAGELAGQIGAEWSDLPSAERATFGERVTAIAEAPRVLAARARVEARHGRPAGGASDLGALVDAALDAQGWERMEELGELAVPHLLELLQPDAAFDEIFNRDPLQSLARLVPERLPAYLDERVPEPSPEFLRRLQKAVIRQRILSASEAWVGCDAGHGRFAWPEWIPWIARMTRERSLWEEHKRGSESVIRLLEPLLVGDASTPELNEALADLLSEANESVLSDAVQRLDRIVVTNYSSGSSHHTEIRRLASLDSLVDRLLFHPDRRLRRLAAQLSATRRDLGLLRHAARDADPEVRAFLAAAFGEVLLKSFSWICGERLSGAGRARERGPVDLVPGDEGLLLGLARDDVDSVQLAALASLAERRFVSLPGSDAEAIWESGSSSIRAALLSVPVAPDSAWAQLVRDGLASKAPAVQLAAAEALERADSPVTSELYEFARERPEARSRLAALRCAARAVPERFEDELIAFIDDDSELVRDRVIGQLDQIVSSAGLVRVGSRLSSRSSNGLALWLRARLYEFEGARFPDALVELVKQDLAHGDSAALSGGYAASKGPVLGSLVQHAPGLRAVTLWAIASGKDWLWKRALTLEHVENDVVPVATFRDDPAEASAQHWEAWRTLSDEDLSVVLDALRQRGATAAAISTIIERAETARLVRLLELSSASDEVALLGWRKVALGSDEQARRTALHQLGEIIIANIGADWLWSALNNSHGALNAIDPAARAEWLIELIESGVSAQEFSTLVGNRAAQSFESQFVDEGLRRRFVEVFVQRWGVELEALRAQFQAYAVRCVLAYAGPYPDLVSDEDVVALGEDASMRQAVWDVVEARKSDAFLPMLQEMLLVYQPQPTLSELLGLLRAYPPEISEPMLIDAAQRTASVTMRDACLTELEQRARVRDARAAYESRQRDAAAHARALTEVLALLDDDDGTIRAEAARALGALGGAEQLPRLIALLRDEGAEVRKAAREAIERIHGRDAPSEPAEPEEPVEAHGG